MRHKLFGVTDEAFIALENVSGTILAAEGHDLIAALYTGDGRLLCCGAGILNHPSCAAQSVKTIIERFADGAGIYDGDVFMMNDPAAGALHAPDVFIIQPIFHEDRLLSWVAAFIHVTDMGSIDPGGFCPSAREVFHEGFQTAGLKLVERGRYRQDVWDTILNMSRTPEALGMDFKSLIAAGYVAKDRLLKLVADFGVDTVLAVGEDLIRESDELLARRLLEIPDGIYRARRYFDLDEEVFKIEVAANKEGDRLTFDFAGTSDQTNLPINAYKWGARGGVFSPIFSLLCWDIFWNEGILERIDFEAPDGSIVNCQKPAPTSVSSIGVITLVNQLVAEIISKMLGASETYKHRACGNWLGIYNVEVIAGIRHDGVFTVAIGTDVFGGSGGARATKDGVDVGGDISAIISTMSNCETLEQRNPVRYLFRRIIPDSGGAGKYRGGCSVEFAHVAHASPARKFTYLAMPGAGVRCPPALGVFGGLPGITSAAVQYRNANVDEFPSDVDEIRAERVEYLALGGTDIEEGDILYNRQPGGGGYGDPLERDPAAVASDVLRGFVSRGAARDVYGAILRGEMSDADVDANATGEQRLAIRLKRLGKTELPASPDRGNVPPGQRRIGEYLQIANGAVQCTYCGHELCASSERWKDNAVSQRQTVAEAGLGRDEQFFLVSFFCPNCATALDRDVVYQDDEPVHDEFAPLT